MKLYRNVFQVKVMCHVHSYNYSCSPFLSYGPLIVFMLILCNLHYCYAISHSEFSQDDVLGTRMNVPPF